MEIDPKYADCICRRFQEYTGKQAVLDSDGRSFDEIARQRRGSKRLPPASSKARLALPSKLLAFRTTG
jgi:hypothetical protein